MSKASIKEKVLKSIEKLPHNASLDDIILKIYIAYNIESEISETESIGEYPELLYNFGRN